MAILRNVILWLFVVLPLGNSVQAETIAATVHAAQSNEVAATYTIPAPGTLGGFCDARRNLAGYGDNKSASCPDTEQATSVTCNIIYFGSCSSIGTYNKTATCPSGYQPKSGQPSICVNTAVYYTCPSSGGWSLSGSNCTRADCRVDQSRNENSGVCECPVGKTDNGSVCVTNCPSGYHVGVPDNGQCIADCTGRQTQAADGQCKCTPSGGVISAPRAALDAACVGGCSIKWNVGLRSLDNTSVYGYVSFNGSTCTGSTSLIPANVSFVPKDTSGKAADGVTPDPLNKPENNQSPEACDAVGGSWGVYNGASKCLSTKDINTMDKLTVTKQTSTTVNSDGTSTVKTDTTYKTTDTSGNVTTSTSSSTTNKDASGAVVGTGSGTTTGTGPDPSAASDLCKNNPGLDICNNRLNKEETQAKVLEALQGDGDYSPITNANGDTKKAEADAAHQSHLDNLTNGTFDAAVSTQKQTVADLIGSWWEPVPMTGCTPYTATIGGRTWTLDICPTAEKISTVSGYAMWVFLAFGVLGLFVKRGAE